MGAKVQWRKDRGAWYLIVHSQRDRTVRRFGATLADKRRAEKAADEINHRLALGQYEPSQSQRKPAPFRRFAQDWLRRKVRLPIERGLDGHLSDSTASMRETMIRRHLTPYFCDRDLREIRIADVQAFYDHCLESGRPRTLRSIEIAIGILRMIFADGIAQELLPANVVDNWKAVRGRRAGGGLRPVDRREVLTLEELQRLLEVARELEPHYYALFVFLADTGPRLGEPLSLRWIDVELGAGLAHLERVKTKRYGRTGPVELSPRLIEILARRRPHIFHDDTLVFTSKHGAHIDLNHFRNREFSRVVRRALGRERHFTPHGLRHTFASLHMAAGTPLKWIQEQGGWRSAKMLLDVYGHFMRSEMSGYAGALTAPDGTRRHQDGSGRRKLASPAGVEPAAYCLGGSRSIQLSYGDGRVAALGAALTKRWRFGVG